MKEKNEKSKQKPRAHASDRDMVSTGVKQSRRAHQSDRKSLRMKEKIGGRLTSSNVLGNKLYGHTGRFEKAT